MWMSACKNQTHRSPVQQDIVTCIYVFVDKQHLVAVVIMTEAN